MKEFGQTLKHYRTQKRYTQQQLAQRLGVSDKTVSKWECGGGLPDVALLAPLARALGVTVDDLLNEQAPLRQLQKQDWQNLLAYAFSLGGGVLFFLLCLFAPAPLAWCIYLGCLAYGAYLQKYYCFKTRWFFGANLVMLVFVNGKAAFAAAGLCLTAVLYGGMGLLAAIQNLGMGPVDIVGNSVLIAACLTAVFTALLTAPAALALWRYLYGNGQGAGLRLPALCLKKPVGGRLWPLAVLAVQAAFLALYGLDSLPGPMYLLQPVLFWLLGGACVAALAWACKRSQGWAGAARVAVLGLASGLALPMACMQAAYNREQGHVLAQQLFGPGLDPGTYRLFWRPAGQFGPAVLALAAAFVLLCSLGVRRRGGGNGGE